MSSFTEPLDVRKFVEKIPKKFLWIIPYKGTYQYWQTLREFRYYVGEEGSPDYIDVREGLKTDFASVPRGLWNIFPPDGAWSQAAVLHDYLYQTHIKTRQESDRIFFEAMGVLEVPWITRRIMYRAVRLFGSKAWWKGYKHV